MSGGLVTGDDGVTRCWWPGGHADYVAYHDHEWGRPVVDDHRLFEKLCLEGFQAGLSWLTILRKRDRFREVFAGFDPAVVAGFGAADVERLLGDAGIVRHRGKVESTVNNAARCLELAEEFGSLAAYVWSWEPVVPVREPDGHPRVDGPVTRPEAAGLVVRRAHHRLRLHAGHGHGQRPPPRLRRPPRGRVAPRRPRPPVVTVRP